MTLRVREGATTRIAKVRVRQVSGGGPSVVKSVYVRDATNNLVQVYASLTAQAYPYEVSGQASKGSSTAIVTDATSAYGFDGSPPYSFSWTSVSGWTTLNPTAALTRFRANSVGPEEYQSAVFTCTVTDSAGATAQVSVTANAVNVYSTGGA